MSDSAKRLAVINEYLAKQTDEAWDSLIHAVRNIGPATLTNDEKAAIEGARLEYVTDEIEIDDNPCVSSSDEGTFVAAWVWIPWTDLEDDDADQEDA